MAVADSRRTTMEEQSVQIVDLRQARRVLTHGDIKSDVAFQHDVNRLLASLEDLCDAAESATAGAAERTDRTHD